MLYIVGWGTSRGLPLVLKADNRKKQYKWQFKYIKKLTNINCLSILAGGAGEGGEGTYLVTEHQ